MILSGVVVYRDGRREPFEAFGAEQMEWEAYAHRHGLPLTATAETLPGFPGMTWQYYLAYSAFGVTEGFDVWKKTVADIERAEEAEPVPPTLPEATAAQWSNSPLPSDGALRT